MAMTEEQLEAFGEQVTKITERLGEMANALNIIVASQSQIAKSAADAKAKTDSLAEAADKSGRALENKAKIEQEVAQEQKKREDDRNTAQTHAINALASFGDALINSERSFSKYNSVIGNSTDALGSLLSILGPVGKGLALLTKLIGVVAQGAANQADSLVKATDELKNMGAIGAFTSEEFLDLANNAGVASSNFGILIKPLQNLGSGLMSIGSTAGKGAEEFLKITEVLPETRMQFRRLGIDQEQLIESQANYLALQQTTGRQILSNNRTTDQLQKASLAYTKNLLELEALTGKSAEQLQKEMNAALAREEYMVQNALIQQEINHLTREGATEGERQRAEGLQRELEVRDKFVTEVSSRIGSKDIDTAIMQMISSGGAIFDEEAARLTRTLGMSGESFERFRLGIEKGDEGVIDDFLETFKEAQSTTIGSLGRSLILGGQEVRDAFGISAETMVFGAARAGKDEADAREEATSAIEKAMKEEFDAIISGRAALTEVEIKAAVALDQVLYPAAEILSFGFIGLNSVVNELILSFNNLLGLIPGYESKSELQGDIASEQEDIEKARQKLAELEQDDSLFSQTRRNMAQNSIDTSLDRQATQAATLIEKGGTVDEEVLTQVIERVKKQLADSEQIEERIEMGQFLSSDDRRHQLTYGTLEEVQQRLDILTQAQTSSAPVEPADVSTARSTGEPATPDMSSARESRIATERETIMAANSMRPSESDLVGTVEQPATSEVSTVRPTEVIPDKPATPDVPSARESRIATERENSNRRIQLSREGYSRSEIESMMAANSMRPSGALLESDLVGTVEQPATSEVSTARLSEETPTDHYLKTVAELESGNNPNARASTSSASGTYQITDKTWEDAVSQMGKDWTIGDKNDTAKQEEVVNYLYDQQREALERELGRKTTEQEMYMAHFLGQADAIKLLTEAVKNPQTNASELLPSAAESNPAIFSEGTTALDIVNELTSKFNVVSNRVASEANATVSELPNEIASLTTPDAPAVTQTAPRALASAIETPTPAQVTAAITPAPVVQPTQPTTPVVTTTTTAQANNANANTDINDIMSLLSYKLDAVIALLDTGISIQDRILLESRS